MNYWICIVNKKNWDIIKNEQIWGVKYNKKKIIKDVEIGDKIVFYIKGGILRGIYEVNSDMFENYSKIFNPHQYSEKNELFPFRVRIKQITKYIIEINIVEIVEKLEFIKNKKKWAAYFFRTMIKLTNNDYLTLKKNMKKHEVFSKH